MARDARSHTARGDAFWSQRYATVLDPDGNAIVRFLTTDNGQRRQFGWRPDENPAEGQVSGRLDAVWMEPGEYQIREITPSGVKERTFSPSDSPPRVLMSRIPDGATGIMALRWSNEGGHDGLAYASNQPGGIAFLPLGEGEWDAAALGVGGYEGERITESARGLAKGRLAERREAKAASC